VLNVAASWRGSQLIKGNMGQIIECTRICMQMCKTVGSLDVLVSEAEGEMPSLRACKTNEESSLIYISTMQCFLAHLEQNNLT
jgi:hypothetical protein